MRARSCTPPAGTRRALPCSARCWYRIPTASPRGKAAQKAETSLQGKQQEAQQEAQKAADADKAMQLAQAAFNQGDFGRPRNARTRSWRSTPAARTRRSSARTRRRWQQAAEAAKKKAARSAAARPAGRSTVLAMGRVPEVVPTWRRRVLPPLRAFRSCVCCSIRRSRRAT